MGFRKDFPIEEDVFGKTMAIAYFESEAEAKNFAVANDSKCEKHEVPIDVNGHKCFASVRYHKKE